MHVLEQIQNIKSYGFVRDLLDKKALQVHGLWFDIGDGEMFLYSKNDKKFLIINEQTLETTFSHLITADWDINTTFVIIHCQWTHS